MTWVVYKLQYVHVHSPDSEDPLFQDPIKVPLVKNPKVEGTKSRGSSKDVSNVVDKSKDELQGDPQ